MLPHTEKGEAAASGHVFTEKKECLYTALNLDGVEVLLYYDSEGKNKVVLAFS